MTKEQYDYGYSPGGLPADTWGYTRTEANGDVYLIAFDRLNRIKREKRTNGMTTHFQFDHTYDSAGNRTALTISGTQYPARNFGYNYNGMGHMTQITENTNLNNYTAAATTDANGNITQIEEKWNGTEVPRLETGAIPNTFEYDRENRLTEHVTAAVGVTVEHAYDGLGRLVKTTRAVSGGAEYAADNGLP